MLMYHVTVSTVFVSWNPVIPVCARSRWFETQEERASRVVMGSKTPIASQTAT